MIRALLGLVLVSGLFGTGTTALFSWLMHRWLDQKFASRQPPAPPPATAPKPAERFWLLPFLVGILERAIFTYLVARIVWSHGDPAATGLISAMVGWCALKLAAGWQRVDGGATTEKGLEARARAFAGLLGSTISLVIAFAGGLIWAGIWWSGSEW